MKLNILVCCLFIHGITLAQTHSGENHAKMQWWADAKLGIFIHAGIYSVDGVDESWAFYNKKISHADYMKQLNGFTLSRYDPAAWASLIRSSGAGYAVITTKHHDGVAMYDTRMNRLSSTHATPAARDMIKPLYGELRKAGIRCGAYYSLIDWSHPDYPAFTRDSSRYKREAEPERWAAFMEFMNGQISEIGSDLNPDLWWFDGDWEHPAEAWEAARIRSRILEKNPNAIINGRLQGFGDYETPEQNFPVARPPHKYWELCMTLNNNWGFQHADSNWKTPYEVISIFADVVANGGNLLLDIGPKEDGTLPDEGVQIIHELGKWNHKHHEAIFSSRPGLPQGHFYGPSTLSADSTCLYLFLPGNPHNGIIIRGLFDDIKSMEVLGRQHPLAWKIVGKISWSPVPGLVFIDVPHEWHDPYLTVVKVKLKRPVRLYKGTGGLSL